MSKSHVCINCDKPIPWEQNFCSWECQIELAKQKGGVVHTPNNLPIMSIDRNNNMYECEHGDHPDYKFPVMVEYIAPLTENDYADYRIHTHNEEPVTEEQVRASVREQHALIYTDGCIAVTMYECCYAMWHVSSAGLLLGEDTLHKKKQWQLSKDSLEAVRKYAANLKIGLAAPS